MVGVNRAILDKGKKESYYKGSKKKSILLGIENLLQEDNMKKKIVAYLMCMMCVLGTGCDFAEKPATPNQTIITAQPEDKTKENEEEKTEGKMITDPTEIEAMAGTIVQKMTLEEKIGQMFVVNLEQLDNTKGSYYEFRQFTDDMKDKLEEYKVGGVILFARNIESIPQTKLLIEQLQNNATAPLFISVDEEGGEVARIGNNSNMRTTKFPTMEQVGAMEDLDYAYNMGATIGQEIKELGFNLNFAPCADVKTNEYNTEIGSRAFGSDPKLVSKMVKQVVYGMQDQGISATLKHFPGHGSASGDSHVAPVNIDTDLLGLRTTEFLPFSEGINAGADFVMVSHISISKVTENTVPACMSKLVLQNMLRQELKFDGVIITDAMDMGAITRKYKPDVAAVNCVKAGVDIVLMSTDLEKAYAGVYDAVKEGKISEEQIDESVKRIVKVKIKRGIILSDTNLLD